MIEQNQKADIDWQKTPLIPVVVQNASDREVVMLAYANAEALELSISTGFAHYYSRSRKSLWKKGETSGNLQEIVEIRLDCDCDALLYIVNQRGVACHTGERSCFYSRITDLPS